VKDVIGGDHQSWSQIIHGSLAAKIEVVQERYLADSKAFAEGLLVILRPLEANRSE